MRTVHYKINIFLLIDCLDNFQAGAERQILELIKNIDQERFNVMVGCLFPMDGALIDIEKFGIQTISFKVKRIYDLKGICQGFRFKKLMKDREIDILVTYHFGSDIWGTVFGKLGGVSRIVSNRRDAGFWRRKHHILAYQFINQWVNDIIVVSRDIKRIIMKEERISDPKVVVIHNGINLERFSLTFDIDNKKAELGLPPKAKTIVCVGNFRPIKGHKYLIEGMQKVIARFPEAHILMIGEGDLRAELESLCDELGIKGQVHFLGKCLDIPEILTCADLCVLPSLSEGMSNALLEYMASGKPVVATNVGGNPEVIDDGLNGILVEKGNSDQLADQIIRVLSDPKGFMGMGKKARLKVEEHFTIEKMIGSYQQFILRSLN